jgi:PPK2 family polyphosphate:nucleotide phosphotransferase
MVADAVREEIACQSHNPGNVIETGFPPRLNHRYVLPMPEDIEVSQFLVDGSRPFGLADHPAKLENVYQERVDYKMRLRALTKQIDLLQQRMYAHDRFSVLLIFQAMDAAGKDGTIRRVISGVDPHGITVNSFKNPSHNELDHDFLWRTSKVLPRRGHITVFNRSYYEETLIVRVHPEILTDYQRVPDECTRKLSKVWKGRYRSIREHEKHLTNNGTKVIKLFLNVSKDEQKRRFIDRIDREEKNWKFNEGDVKERAYWNEYMQAYEDTINATARKFAPWYVIPADDKMNMRLFCAQVLLNEMKNLDTCYPPVDAERKEKLQQFRKDLLEE